MNIFYLHTDPYESAKRMCNKHVVKMILETAQLLSTAHHELDGESPAYKPTHRNHPSAVWARSSADHYSWLVYHLDGLSLEYTRRYGKVHKTISEHFDVLSTLPTNIADSGYQDPPQCMPDECKRPTSVEGYNVYYQFKNDEWSERGKPMVFS
jgi:hypothetical protein